MRKLQSESVHPLYHQLMQRIRDDIEKGTYPVGSRIPPENELGLTYDVSRVTVRRALAELTAEGLLERKQGKGTFVSLPRISRDLKSVHSFHDSCRQNGVRPGTQVLRVREIEADREDREELNLGPEARVLEIVRLRTADEVPVVLEENRFSTAYAYLMDMDLRGSLYQALREYGVEPADAIHEVSLIRAGETEAKALQIEVGTPLLQLRELIYDRKGRPLHRSRQWIRGDRFTFRI